MKRFPFVIGVRSIGLPAAAVLFVAALIAFAVPTDQDGNAGFLGVVAILSGAVVVGGVALWALHLEHVRRSTRGVSADAPPTQGETLAIDRPASLEGVASEPRFRPRHALAVAASVTVVVLAQGASFENELPTQDESPHQDKAATGTLDQVAGETVAR